MRKIPNHNSQDTNKSQSPIFKIQYLFENLKIIWKLSRLSGIPRLAGDIGNWKFQSGFTLIELLISIAILVLIIGLSMAGYARFSQRQALINAGQTLKNFLRDAQSRAYTGEQECAGSTSFEGWYVNLTSPDYTMYSICGDGTHGTEIDIPISSDITIASSLLPAPANEIIFHAYPPGIDKSGSICLSDIRMERAYYKISLEVSGEISDSSMLVDPCP